MTTVNGRIDAVARAHTVLSLNAWTGASLRDLINAEFSPFRQLARITVDGPDLVLIPQAAQALSLLIHELTTNAVKYGSLSVPDGRLAVTWDMCVDGRALIEWNELEGPELVEPQSKGFGERLIMGCSQQLGGEVTRVWRPSGLLCIVSLGASRMRQKATYSKSR